jgi:Flp pilus assembly protein TadB
MLYVAAIPRADWSVVSLATPVAFVVLEAIVLALLCRQYLRPARVSRSTQEFRQAA